MPRQSLTREQRAEALRKWWETFPYGNHDQRMRAICSFEREYGPLTEDEKRAAMFRFSPAQQLAFGPGPVRLVVDHPEYQADVTLSDEQRHELAGDFAP